VPRFVPVKIRRPDSENEESRKGIETLARPRSAAAQAYARRSAFPREFGPWQQTRSLCSNTATGYSSAPRNSVNVVLCLDLRFCSRGTAAMTRSGLGWPTRSRALALIAFTAENVFFFARFFAAMVSP